MRTRKDLPWYRLDLRPQAMSPAALEGAGGNGAFGSLRQVAQGRIEVMNVRPKVLVSGAFCAALALGLGLSVQPFGPLPLQTPEGRAALVRALETQPLIAGRLTGGFGRAVDGPSGTAAAERKAILEIRRQRDAAALPEALADRGVLELFAQRWDEAVVRLEEAAARSPRNARIATDLAAAYLERGRRAGRSQDDFLALVAAQHAVTIDPRLPEALFNQASALERLGLQARARAAWAQYLAHEPEPGWAAAGEERLEALEHASLSRVQVDRKALEAAVARRDQAAVRAAVALIRQPSRRLGEEELLSDWARAYLAGDLDQATRFLGLARAVGDTLAVLSRDNLLRDAVAAIDTASPVRLEALAHGHLEYQAGRHLYKAADYKGAISRLQAARSSLTQGGSPFALRAEYAVGSCEHYLSLRASALRRFTAVGAQAADSSYRSLRGESLWMEGLVHFAGRDVPPALAAYGRALATFEAIGETENIAGIHALLAEIDDFEGEIEKGWEHRLAALRESLAIGDAARLFQVYAEAMIAATRQGEHRVALYFQEEALRNARQVKNPIAIAQALFWRSRNHQRLGLAVRAVEDLQRARAVLADAQASQIKERTEADISLAEAELAAERAPDRAVPLLSEALSLYLQGGHRTNLLDILGARARAHEFLGNLPDAEADLETAARWIEDWRGRIESSAERISFLAKSEQLFDALILLHLERKRDPERAFDTLERQRARALLDSVGLPAHPRGTGPAPAVQPLAAREISAQLAANAVVVSYALLGDRLYAFAVDRRGVRLSAPISTDWPSIETRIAAYRAGLAGHAEAGELDRLSGRLYEILIDPLAGALPSGAHLILSGDASLQTLPFAALRNPRTGRYLVQDHVLTIAPSASVYLASAGRFRERARRAPRSLVLLSHPVVDRRRYPMLRPLSWAQEETRRAAALYPEVVLRGGGEATVDTFLREAPGGEVVHFLGHAIKAGRVRGTCLVLALPPGASDGDLLCGEEIERLHLDRTRLVILSACSTAGGLVAQGEGVASLARAFVAAGAPAVLGTSWNVKDRTANLFLSELHRSLREGADPAEALQSAQLRFLGSADPDRQSPRFWANFQLIGGTS